MAKFYGNATKTGKIGGSVFAIRHGETIERQYQPIVSNPKSTKQVIARATMKLLTQVSASLSSINAFVRQGNVSPHNLFVKANYQAVGEPTVSNGDINVALEVADIDLTGGVTAMPNLITPVVSGSTVPTGLLSAAEGRISRVLYALVGVKEGYQMTVLDVIVVEEPGAGRTFSGSLTLPAGATGNMAIFAYGMGDLTENARVTYEHYRIGQTPAAAVVNAIRHLSTNDVIVTQTVELSFTLA